MFELKARGPRNKTEELRIELCDKINALGIGAQGLGGLTTVLDVKIAMYPTHAASKPVAMIPNCAATRHAHFVLDGSGPAYIDPPSLDLWPDVHWQPDYNKSKQVNLDTLTRGRGGQLEAGRHAAAQRQDAHRPRRRAQAHPGHAGQGREAAGGLHQPRHLLRRPGGPGARRGGRPGRPDHRHAHGQVHRDDAGADRPDRHDRQGRARPSRHRGHQEAQERLPDGRGRRRLPGGQGHQGRQGGGLRRPGHGSDLRVRRQGHAGDGGRLDPTAPACTTPGRRSGRRGSARSRWWPAEGELRSACAARHPSRTPGAPAAPARACLRSHDRLRRRRTCSTAAATGSARPAAPG